MNRHFTVTGRQIESPPQRAQPEAAGDEVAEREPVGQVGQVGPVGREPAREQWR
ncbi:MAG: hypothetical protein FWD42_06585 [Solirubrobacterales bacterium]|nr:hypothetical protein [Solirubrobacterales bacterium]